MTSIVAEVLLALVLPLGAGSSVSSSGLRGTVLLDPAYPVCAVGESCTRPAKHVVLRFSRGERIVAHVRTDGRGRYRIGLAPAHTYVVSTSSTGAALRPQRVKVVRGKFRRVIFKLDTGIR